MRYRNSEGYADPTAGAAIAHIAYEERQQKRLEQQKKQGAAKRKKAMTNRNKGNTTASPCCLSACDQLRAWLTADVPTEQHGGE